jgi:two-component system, LuxR family, sensor kinase FixL
MSTLSEASAPIRRLRELESALAGSATKADCLQLLRETLAETPGGTLTGSLSPQNEATRNAGEPSPGQPFDAFGTAVLQTLPTPIAALDANGTIVAINDAWSRLATENRGCPSSELGVGKNYLEVCNRACGDRSVETESAERGIRAVLEGKESLFTLEYPCSSANVRRWFSMAVTPLPVKSSGVLVTHLDITSRKLGEDMARCLQAQLDRVARMHTLGTLATAVTHEISQPLAAIGIYSNAAAHLLDSDKASPGELAEVLRQIETQIKRAGEILGRVRELTRWRDAGKAPIDLCETIADAIRLIRPMATERQGVIMLDALDEPVRVCADRIQIARAVINLLCNGIEAIALADGRERWIRVSVRREGTGAHIAVTDSGPGIRPGWGERIFDIFETDKATGSGMGLALSRSLVERHGGRLWADTEHKPGAAFHFTLPGTPEGQVDSE